MKISVITVTWNSERTLEDTIQSLRTQSYSNVEYIVIDGNSTDHTMNIIEDNRNIIDRVVSENDSGIYDALNKGISLATGDVVGFLHSDDTFAHNDVLKHVASLFVQSQSDSIYGDLNYVTKNDPTRVIRKWRSGEFSRDKFLNGWMPPHPTFYMKRNLYLKYGFFDLNYKIAADYDSLLRYLWKHRVSAVYLPEVLINMRVGGESNRSVKNIIRKSKEDIQSMRLNGLPTVRALLGKNISKIPQFFTK